jgi:hypothetical protein
LRGIDLRRLLYRSEASSTRRAAASLDTMFVRMVTPIRSFDDADEYLGAMTSGNLKIKFLLVRL